MKGPVQLEVQIQTHVSVVFFVQNNNSHKRSFISELILPEGWKSINQTFTFELDPGEKDMRVMHFYVPPDVLAGDYRLSFFVKDRDNPHFYNENIFLVSILPSVRLELKSLEAPSYSIAGDDYTAQFVVMNTGNTPANYNVTIKCGEGYNYTLNSPAATQDLFLDIDKEQIIEVVVHTDATITRGIDHRLQVVLDHMDETTAQREIMGSAIIYVEIIPTIAGEESFMHTLPVELGIKGLSEYYLDWNWGLEAELRSKGTLDEDGYHHLDLRINKKIDTEEDLLLNSRDRYSFAYSSPLFEVMLGDHGYSLSPLLNRFHYARGAGGKVIIMPFNISSYYYQDVWSNELSQMLAGSVAFILENEEYQDGYNYKAALNVMSPLENSFFVGIHQLYYPVTDISLELDLATELDQSGLFNKAGLVQASGDHDWIYYKLTVLYADPEFDGYYTDLYRISVQGGLRLLERRLHFNSLFYITEKNLLNNEELPLAQLKTLFQLGAGYVFPQIETDLSFYWQHIYTLDKFPDPDYNKYENNFNLKLKQPLGFFDLNLNAQLGFDVDTIDSVFTCSHEYTASANFILSTIFSFNFMFSYDGFIYSLYNDSDKIGLGLYTLFDWDNTELQAGIRNNYSFNSGELTWFNIGFNVGFSHTFENKHTISFYAIYTFAQNIYNLGNTFAFWIKYNTPFEIPISRKKSVAILKGHIYDEKTKNGIGGVILRLDGLSAVTDSSGNFTFYLSKSGNYYLTVDRSKLGVNMIPNMKTPVRLNIEGGKENSIEIGIIESATVKGQVAVYGFPDEQEGFVVAEETEDTTLERVKLSGLGNILVEITNGTETLRRLTNSFGEFTFEEVKSGEWTFRILAGKIPAYHHYEKQELVFSVVPGQIFEFTIKVLQEKRKIKIIEESATIQLEPETTAVDTSEELEVTSETAP